MNYTDYLKDMGPVKSMIEEQLTAVSESVLRQKQRVVAERLRFMGYEDVATWLEQLNDHSKPFKFPKLAIVYMYGFEAYYVADGTLGGQFVVAFLTPVLENKSVEGRWDFNVNAQYTFSEPNEFKDLA